MRLISLLLAGLVVLPSLGGCDRQKADASQAPASTTGTVKGIDRSYKGKAAPTSSFNDPDGRATSIAQFAGKPVLVNLWASWCGPCIKELPTLEALEAEQGKDGALVVVAVSQDSESQPTVTKFLEDKKIGRFAAYHDPEMALTDALGVQVMPTTILYDAAGKEVWRFTGDMDWNSTEARAMVKEALD